MKRALSIMLAVALACSFVFAGSVAASDSDGIEQEIEQDADLEQEAEAELEQEQDVEQTNVGLQGGNFAFADDGGDATAANSMSQTNANEQVGVSTAANYGEIDQDAENEVEFEFGW